MGRGPCTFKIANAVRLGKALKALQKAGVEISRVELHTDGKLVMIPGSPQDPAAVTVDALCWPSDCSSKAEADSEIEKWLAKHAHQRQRN